MAVTISSSVMVAEVSVLALIASATAVSLPVSFDVPAPMAYTSHWLEDDHLEPS